MVDDAKNYGGKIQEIKKSFSVLTDKNERINMINYFIIFLIH